MNPIVTIAMDASEVDGTVHRVQTQFCCSQIDTPGFVPAQVKELYKRLRAITPAPPRHRQCTDGKVRVSKPW